MEMDKIKQTITRLQADPLVCEEKERTQWPSEGAKVGSRRG